LYYDEGKIVEAEPLIEKSLASMQMSLGPDHPEVAKVYATLAALYVTRSMFDEAESSCQHALKILEKTSLPDYSSLVAALSTYASLLSKTNRKAEAELLEARAMTYSAKFHERNNAK